MFHISNIIRNIHTITAAYAPVLDVCVFVVLSAQV